jgi:mannose-6-phosphate isomerase-like protein (cupin superfamily)
MMELRKCRAEDSGWRPDVGGEPDLRTRGEHLDVELRAWRRGEQVEIASAPHVSEELGAVLEGRFELVCGDERYELEAGAGILIPPREGHRWTLLSDHGVLYRVFGPPIT